MSVSVARARNRSRSSAIRSRVMSSMIVTAATGWPSSPWSGAAFSNCQRSSPVDRLIVRITSGSACSAGEQAHRRDRIHREILAVLVLDDVVVEDRVRRTALHFLERDEAHRLVRGAIRVHDVMVRVADRHRLGERIEDLAEPGLAPAQLRLELAQQLRPLGHVVDPGVEQWLAARPVDRDRHLDRELAAVPVGPPRRSGASRAARPPRHLPPIRPRDAMRRDGGRGSARERSARPARIRAPPHASSRTARSRGDSTRAPARRRRASRTRCARYR